MPPWYAPLVTTTDDDQATRIQRARICLEGLSVGDAFGQLFFVRDPQPSIEQRALGAPPWMYTDDTHMTMSVVEELARAGRVDRDRLALQFARRHRADPMRGYGAGARQILEEISSGVPWHVAAGAAFGGSGSKGNGAAMRSAPVGAYFSDDLARVANEAIASAAPTHAHADAQAGAVAVAIAAAVATRIRQRGPVVPGQDGDELLREVYAHTPDGETRAGIARAIDLDRGFHIQTAAHALGNGALVLSHDTVPLALWCAARHLDSYEEALWTTVAALGDRDTTCAIVGGIVVCAVGLDSIPTAWRSARESMGEQFAIGGPSGTH